MWDALKTHRGSYRELYQVAQLTQQGSLLDHPDQLDQDFGHQFHRNVEHANVLGSVHVESRVDIPDFNGTEEIGVLVCETPQQTAESPF